LKGLNYLLHSTSPQYVTPLPEVLAPLLEKLLSDDSPFTHVASSHSSFAKSVLPRVAARLDVPAVSDVTSVEHHPEENSTIFTRPIYAGNAISTVRAPASIPLKFFTVRSTAFTAAEDGDGAEAELKALDPVEVPDCPTQHVKTSLVKLDRPDLGVASRVVSGGRALKNAETFKSTIYPLADVLGAAVGASRAAVDAGYADNSLQVGQTGKVVAPELYVAVGISGAIQHLAGMKDSKLIVAINKASHHPCLRCLISLIVVAASRIQMHLYSMSRTLESWETCSKLFQSWWRSSNSKTKRTVSKPYLQSNNTLGHTRYT
jgi:electron transfer flavoprotein alpha subunit